MVLEPKFPSSGLKMYGMINSHNMFPKRLQVIEIAKVLVRNALVGFSMEIG